MAEEVTDSSSQMSAEDLEAIATYLKAQSAHTGEEQSVAANMR